MAVPAPIVQTTILMDYLMQRIVHSLNDIFYHKTQGLFYIYKQSIGEKTIQYV